MKEKDVDSVLIRKGIKTTDKPIVYAFVELLAARGIIKYAILSPGSRNAPLINAFTAKKDIKCLSIVDERSAGFFALGIAQQTRCAVPVVCTSGTAVLNYAPAIAEAYYQKIPLLIITADRPPEMIDKDDGQTIRQVNIFSNYIRASFNLPLDMNGMENILSTMKMAVDAYDATGCENLCIPGPVHINVPLREPLYGTTVISPASELSKEVEKSKRALRFHGWFTNGLLDAREKKEIAAVWQSAQKKLIICGLAFGNKELTKLLSVLSKDNSVTIFTETTSNLLDERFISNIDAVLETFNDKEQSDFAPDLLITIGGPVTSKKLKQWLRKNKPKTHWQVSSHNNPVDTYQCLTKVVTADEKEFFGFLVTLDEKYNEGEHNYGAAMQIKSKKAMDMLTAYCTDIPFSDLKAFQMIFEHLPGNSDVHLGNSTPIRYANLFRFDKKRKLKFFSNRGVSGIDGTVSTSAGAAFCSNKITTLITGDLAFFYDSNILWCKYLKGNLRVIIINNGGGGIFRIIDGARDSHLLEGFIEAKHTMKAEKLVKSYGFPFYGVKTIKELERKLPEFFKPHENKPVFMEISTPPEVNAEQYHNYFKQL